MALDYDTLLSLQRWLSKEIANQRRLCNEAVDGDPEFSRDRWFQSEGMSDVHKEINRRLNELLPKAKP